jgi:hypothetical protein
LGNSRIIKRFAAENPRSFDEVKGIASIPVVSAQSPPQPTHGEFYGELLEAMSAGCA